MDELEAVNLMLRSIGQVPVRVIPDSGLSDSRIALEVLKEYTDELQTDGYDFNTFEAYEVTPSSTTGYVTFDQSVVRVWNSQPYPRLTLRGRRLYNLDDQSQVFDKPLKVNLVQLVPFETLPRVLQRYVVIRAARVFGNRVIGAGELNAYGQEDEARARIAWLNAYSEDMQLNVMSNSTHHRPNTYRPFNAIKRSM